MSEFEAQRFLMDEVYEISSTQIDKLRIDFTYKEIDSEGFIFRLTSYEFNGNVGVVITSLNSFDVIGDLYKFRNIHLTKEEFENLNQKFVFLEIEQAGKYTNILQRFNERFIFEISRTTAHQIYYNLWVDNKSRHSLTKTEWNTAFKRFQKFVQE